MENSNENDEVYEDCLEGNENEQNNGKEDEKEKKEENNNEINLNEKEKEEENNNEINNNEEKKENKYIPFTIKQQQEKLKEEDDSPFPENKGKDSDSESEEDKTPLTEGEKKDIEEKIINERKNAGVLYKNGEYLQALNIYSLLLKDAKRAELKEQCCILNCNKGICFNKLNEYDKALESFKEALKYNKDYSKALCNKMLLLNKKEEYLEAYEDFKRLKTLDYELNYKAEIQKKKMTDEMLGKLKDMGNTILGKFGLSLNNFQMTPNGQGGYSIQYNNNK